MNSNKHTSLIKKLNKNCLILLGALTLTACVSYSTPSGKLEVADINYRQGSCRSAIHIYLQSIQKSVQENNLPIAKTAIGRIKERAGGCTFGTKDFESYRSIVISLQHTLSVMEGAAWLEKDTYEFAIWVTDFSVSRITEDSPKLIDLLTKIARKNQDSALEEKAASLLTTDTVAKNNQNASANSTSGRTLEKTHDESVQLIGAVGNALVGINSAGGRNSTQIATIGTAMQSGASIPSIAPNYSVNVASQQKSPAKNCGKINSIDSAKQVCSCEGGRPEQRLKENSTHVQCAKSDIRESWGCSFFKDGSRHQCAVK